MLWFVSAISKICHTDTGTEELAHLEIISTIVHQLTGNLSIEEIKQSGFDRYYVDHTTGIWPQSAGGVPFSATEFQVKGDPIHKEMKFVRGGYDESIFARAMEWKRKI